MTLFPFQTLSMDNEIFRQVDDLKIATSFECSPHECIEIIGSQNNHLKVITQNIRSIYNNLDTFVVLLSTLKSIECDIIILTECHLSKDKPLPSLPNYNSYSSSTFSNKSDGLVIYTKPNLSVVITEPSFDEATCLIVKIAEHTAIVAVYRSPSYRKSNKLINQLFRIYSQFTQWIQARSHYRRH